MEQPVPQPHLAHASGSVLRPREGDSYSRFQSLKELANGFAQLELEGKWYVFSFFAGNDLHTEK